jgi:hypothetical protein
MEVAQLWLECLVLALGGYTLKVVDTPNSLIPVVQPESPVTIYNAKIQCEASRYGEHGS